MNNDYRELEQYLVGNGWKEYPTFPPRWPEVLNRLWHKPLQGIVDCTSNNKPPNLTLSAVKFDRPNSLCITVYVRGEVEETTWYTLEAYSLSISELMQREAEITTKLCRAWNSLTNVGDTL